MRSKGFLFLITFLLLLSGLGCEATPTRVPAFGPSPTTIRGPSETPLPSATPTDTPQPTATERPQPTATPPVLRLLEGFVYVTGAPAEDGILVEARVDNVIVASCRTATVDGRPGYYLLSIRCDAGDEVHVFIEGHEANESPVDCEDAALDLTV